VTTAWTAIDELSGIAVLTATLPSGLPLDTSTVGAKTFSVSATDNAGNAAAVTSAYAVHYWYSGILQQIKPDGSSVFKLGSNIAIRFQLADAAGGTVTDATASLWLAKINNGVPCQIPCQSGCC
jgi:hypothetical protein